MCLQIIATHVTGVFISGTMPIVSVEGKGKLRVTGSPFGNSEDQQGQPDESEGEQLGHAEGFVKEEDAQEQGHGRADVLEKTQHI